MKYRRDIDGLRAVAVGSVILFHAGFSFFSGGFSGVDIFFVISGFLISTIIFDEVDNRNFSISNFYERRVRRIFPALFFVLLITSIFSLIILSPDDYKNFSQSVFATTFFSSNILFWRVIGYFGSGPELKPLLHTWSLGLEEQFYILFPIFVLSVVRFGKKYLHISILIIKMELVNAEQSVDNPIAMSDDTYKLYDEEQKS